MIQENDVEVVEETEDLTCDKLDEWNQLLRMADDKNVPALRIGVANDFLAYAGQDMRVSGVEEANEAMKKLVQRFIWNNAHMAMAVFLVGRDIFDERSVLVHDLFTSLNTYARNAIPGGSSVSKTYSTVIWHGVDFLGDPEGTAIKVAALSDSTLRNNIFENFRRFFDNMILDFGLKSGSLHIGLDTTDRAACITGVTYPPDSKETGRFKGFKPQKRKPHPHYGKLTRIRLILEEASNMRPGVFEDLRSMRASLKSDDPVHVKMTAIFNPYDISHWTARICEPEKGISSLDMEKDHQWKSNLGWQVTRLDGKRCENVVQRKDVVSSMISYEAYKEFEREGEHSVSYCCYARGFWAIYGAHQLLIPRYLLENRKCQPLFTGDVINAAACDMAHVGDKIALGVAKYGNCVGLLWREKDGSERREMFNPENPDPRRKKPKSILWFEQIIELQPQIRQASFIGDAIRNSCRALAVQPNWLAVDSTGSGIDTATWLNNNFGDILNLQWASKATEHRVLVDSLQKPSELYDRISSEMWFAFKIWLENDLVFFAPNFIDEPLFGQLTKRRLSKRQKSFVGKLSVESKEEYKSHEGGISCDEADSAIMILQLIRMRSDALPGMGGTVSSVKPPPFRSVHRRDVLTSGANPMLPQRPSDDFDAWLKEVGNRY
jgi:hypothetical protein